mgnify:CR=1 FL=1
MSHHAVSFDLDDTLYDYREYAAAGLRSAADLLAERTGRDLHEELHDLYFAAEATDGTFDRLVARHDLPANLVSDLVAAFHDATTPLSPHPETEAVLDELAADHRLGLVTEGRGGRAKLRRLGLADRFDAVLVTPRIDRTKRDPAVFERHLADLAVDPSATAYVGDDPRVDFRVPNEMGLTTVRVRRGRYADLEPRDAAAAPDHEVSDLRALGTLL